MTRIIKVLVAIILGGVIVTALLVFAICAFIMTEAPEVADVALLESHAEISEGFFFATYTVYGTAKNIGSGEIEGVRLMVRFYDADGALLDNPTHTYHDIIAGEVFNFEVSYYGEPEDVDSYLVVVESVWWL